MSTLPPPRDALEADMGAVAQIYEPYVLDATTCFVRRPLPPWGSRPVALPMMDT